MAVELIAGLVLGAISVYLVCLNMMRQKKKYLSDAAVELKKANVEVTKLRWQVDDFARKGQSESDLIMIIPDLVKRIFAGENSSEVLHFVNRACQNLLRAKESAVFIADRAGVSFTLSASTGFSDALGKDTSFKLGDGFAGLAAETGKILSRDDLENESTLVKRNLIKSDLPDFMPEYAAPMELDGVLYGVITVGAFEGFGILRKETMKVLAAVGASALRNVRVLEKGERVSEVDSDTGLLRKAALEATLENELERVERFGNGLGIIELILRSEEADDSFRKIIGVAAGYLISSLRGIDTGIRAGRGTIVLLLPGTDTEGIKLMIGKFGGELPILKTEDGTHVGSVEIRSFVVEGGFKLGAMGLLDQLKLQKSMEFDGYYEI